MGSSQSGIGDKTTDPSSTFPQDVVSEDQKTGETSKQKKKVEGLSGVALIEYKCRKKKRAWSRCVADHYEHKFLPGKALEPEEDCDDLFERFRQCYMRGLLKERQNKGMPPPKEGTMLHEFMEEEGMIVPDASTNASSAK
mmetsp:Transcript_431/g.705  ORF Transcript_431/g.705 Transcript_431/m.705 type:complete len:140 (+) Transcript_431:33-452(+)